jgi:prevent-host-death family protein
MAPLKRILVVNDEPSASEHYRRSLANQFEVVLAEAAAQALESVRSKAVDLVVADEFVSGMDGLALLAQVREIAADVPFILLASSPNNVVTLHASARGALCLAKPIDGETLCAAVHQRLEALAALRSASAASAMAAEFLETVTATTAKNEFGRILDAALLTGPVAITKHNERRAVLLSYVEYSRLVAAPDVELDLLTEEFDALLARMQTRTTTEAARSIFSMSSDELGKAAVDGIEKP